MFQLAVDSFPWESEQQKEGYLNWVESERRFGRMPELPIDTKITYLIQKNHEGNEYWVEMISSQISDLLSQIRTLQEECGRLNQFIDIFRETIKTQTLLIEQITKSLKPTAIQ